MKIDFHVHTKYSVDSLSEPKKIIQACRKSGIMPVIADHNTTAAHAEFQALDPGFAFVPAEEISTNEGDLIALFISEPIKEHSFLGALDLIKAQGGLSYLPHMFDITRSGMTNEKLASKVDIIEVFNSRTVLRDANKKAEKFADENNKLKAAGSDAHFVMELGAAYTEISDCELEPRQIIKALNGKNYKLHCQYSPFYLKGVTYAIVAYKKLLGRRL